MNIPNEAVEAAAIASYVRAGGGTPESWPREEAHYRREYLEDARVQLEAAAPHILAVVREQQARLDAVEALAEKWRYKGEFGWGAWQEGCGPDPEGAALDHAAMELRAALTTTDPAA